MQNSQHSGKNIQSYSQKYFVIRRNFLPSLKQDISVYTPGNNAFNYTISHKKYPFGIQDSPQVSAESEEILAENLLQNAMPRDRCRVRDTDSVTTEEGRLWWGHGGRAGSGLGAY